jgi:hypothetical protein
MQLPIIVTTVATASSGVTGQAEGMAEWDADSREAGPAAAAR